MSVPDSRSPQLRLLQSFPRRRRRYPSLRLLPPTPPRVPRTPPNSGHECPGLLTNTAAACGCPDLRLLAALWVPLILPPPPTPQPWGAQPPLAPLTPLPRLRSPPHLARSICGRRPTWIHLEPDQVQGLNATVFAYGSTGRHLVFGCTHRNALGMISQ
ncbi:hypothetical protein U9M48_030077 [Paspalum notatum var. saurae]|uniref:Uncharacterized protein n=1 Tax=Paspalum notatum var. saurae TaxID=547442 RepID=A0AAQ3U2Y2_PASNO